MAKKTGRLQGKVALITGGSGGQGQSQGRMFAREGAAVILADVSDRGGKAAVKEIKAAGGEALYLPLDVRSLDEWNNVVRRAKRAFGGLHILVNNAGVVSRTGIQDISMDEWKRVLDINLTGPMFGCRACAPLIRDSGGGAIVNISSTAGLVGHTGVAYAASKWALRGMTKTAALEYIDWGIRVNSIHPAQVTDTGMSGSATEGYRYANQKVMPMKRSATPDEVTNAVLFLASDESSYMTGNEIVVDGGAVAIGLPRARTVLEAEFNASQKK
jgi:3alpha(or 20beta)-hydroxysteroid dehydrogenase